MPPRKGWLTPNAPIPSDTVCRRVLIPNDLQIIAAVNGALLELTKNYNWEQFGSASPEEIAAAMFAMYQAYVSEPCESGGGCRRIYRIGQGGQIERSDDAGETWESASDEIPPTPSRTEPTEEERLCNAAANVVNVLHQTYEEMVDAWQLDSSVDFGIGAFATILGLLVGSWLGVVSSVAIPFVWELFGSVYATIGTFLQDAWDSDFTNDLTCLFLEAASDTDGVVTFDWNAVSQGLADRVTETGAPEDALLWAQLNYMVLFIGVEGLNAAGATTGVVGDCEEICGPKWCYEFDFTTGDQQDWINQFWNGVTYGSWLGNAWQGLVYGNQRVLWLNRAWIAGDAVITEMECEGYMTSGTGNFLGNVAIYRPDNHAGFILDPDVSTWSQTFVRYSGLTWDVDGMYWNYINSASSAGFVLERIRFKGTGSNPFGSDNCE
jgi:hypothetical protein